MVASLAWGGFRNGFIPDFAMLPIGRGFVLERGAALQFLAARAFLLIAYRIDILDYISETYRDWAGQVYQKQRWTALGKPWNAAEPGGSVHGWGKAIDFNATALYADGIYDIVMATLELYGFIRDVDGEDWHVSFRENTIQKWAADEPAAPIQKIIQEELDMLVYADQDTNVWARGSIGKWEGIPAGQGDFYVAISGHDLIRLPHEAFELARQQYLGSRQGDFGVYADTQTNTWFVVGPGVDYAIPGGQGDLWQTLYGPVRKMDHGSLEVLRDGARKMLPAPDWDGIVKAIADRVKQPA
jgi:hypothetical protein